MSINRFGKTKPFPCPHFLKFLAIRKIKKSFYYECEHGFLPPICSNGAGIFFLCSSLRSAKKSFIVIVLDCRPLPTFFLPENAFNKQLSSLDQKNITFKFRIITGFYIQFNIKFRDRTGSYMSDCISLTIATLSLG